MNLTQLIKDKAHDVGFALVGVTSPNPLPHAEAFKAWLSQGRHGEMAYLASPRSRQCRAHPERLLEACQSVLVLGMRYPASRPRPTKRATDLTTRGRIASYAWGMDYHTLIGGQLQELVQFIEAQVNHRVAKRWYVDTGPILERELAQRAGLGWIGKNTCLINPSGGSYFFLAEILLGLELDTDQPFSVDRCGSCTRCINACPTGCILPDRTLDARRCISYLTIELKGAIPAEMRSLMDGWVFGCDVCQQVCPWNRFATPFATAFAPTFTKGEADKDFSAHQRETELDLVEELGLSEADFNHQYRHSAIRRAKRGGYLRNIAVVLGNLGGTEAVPGLRRALMDDPEQLVRSHAAWALGQIQDPSARHALEKAARIETDLTVKAEILAVSGNG